MVEVLITISILLFVIALGGEFIISGFDILRFQSEQETAVQNARRSTNNLSKDLREARSSERGDYPLVSIQPQQLVWYGDIDNDGEAERIRYFLSGTDFMRVVTQPGAANNYDGEVSTSTIATNLNNGTVPVFRYRDSSNNETAIINQVRLVHVNLMVNVTPGKSPNDYEVESYVHLRNLKDNL